MEAGEGAQASHRRNINPSIREHLRTRRRRGGWRRASSTGNPQAAGRDREGKSLAAALRGDTDIHTHPHNFLQPGSKQLRELPDRSRASLTAHSGRGRLVPVAGWARGTVPYLPAWRRGYVSMALAERSRQRERGRERGARTGLAGAGSAGGAKPPSLPPPLHWSRALPICRHHPGTLPACEPPPGTGRDPNTLPTACPEFAVRPGPGPGPAGALGWGSHRDALMCGALRSAGVPPRLRKPPRVHNPPRCFRGSAHSPTVTAPIPASWGSGGRQVVPVTQFTLPLSGPFLWGLLLWWFIGWGTCRVKSGHRVCVPELEKRLVPPHSLWYVFASLFCRTYPPPKLLSFGDVFGLPFYHSENSQQEKGLLEVCNSKPTGEDPLGIFQLPALVWGFLM